MLRNKRRPVSSLPAILLLLSAGWLITGCEPRLDTTGIAAEVILPQKTGGKGVGFGMEAWTYQDFGARGGYHAVPVPGGLAMAFDIGAGAAVGAWDDHVIYDIQAGLGAYLNSGNWGLGPMASGGVTILFIGRHVGISARYVYAPELLGRGFPTKRVDRLSVSLAFEIPLE